MSFSSSQFKKFAIAAAESADAKKGLNIAVFDARRVPGGPSDYLMLVSANSHVHMKTLRDAIEYSLETMGLRALHRDGTRESRWLALDFGGLLVHIFLEEVRDFFSLERLWPEARKLSWNSKPEKRKSKRKK